MCNQLYDIYFHKNPEHRNKYQSHKKYRVALAHELVQPCFDHVANVGETTPSRPSKRKGSRLQGKHFATSRYPHEKKCCVVCGYKKNAQGKPKFKKTWNYCQKCEKFICKLFFEKYHTRETEVGLEPTTT